jgi:hypothetical protein
MRNGRCEREGGERERRGKGREREGEKEGGIGKGRGRKGEREGRRGKRRGREGEGRGEGVDKEGKLWREGRGGQTAVKCNHINPCQCPSNACSLPLSVLLTYILHPTPLQ